MELCKKYRPTKFRDLIGQKEAVKTLLGFGKQSLPHCLLFTGPSGCGKTTAARILRNKLCLSDADYKEVNTADFRGIDMVRDIRTMMYLNPIGGRKSHRVWLVDECHKLSNDAQNAVLKILEEPPAHVYFVLATTEPNRLLATIRTRATEVRFKALEDTDMEVLIGKVAKAEGIELSEEIVDELIRWADGSARKGLVLLDQIRNVEGDTERKAIIAGGVSQSEAIDLARILLKRGVTWIDVVKVLRGIEGLGEQAEGIRWLVLKYMSSVALKTPKMAARACAVISEFQDNFFDSKEAGLINACYELCNEGR